MIKRLSLLRKILTRAYKFHLKAKKFSQIKKYKILSRSACLGNFVFEKLPFQEYETLKFPNSRVDLLLKHPNKIDFLELSKVNFRENGILLSLVSQSYDFFAFKNVDIVYMDSFSDLTDREFMSKKYGYSIYCNYSYYGEKKDDDLLFSHNGRLNLELAQRYYDDFFDKINRTYNKNNQLKIIFLHFCTKLDSREAFKQRALKIKEIIDNLAKKYTNLHSISIDEDLVLAGHENKNFTTIEAKSMPYHYAQTTYDYYAQKVIEIFQKDVKHGNV